MSERRPRARYREAGAAMRVAFGRARREDLTEADWRVLSAVVELTASWSKLEDRVFVGIIAEQANVSGRQATRSLRRLAAIGVIVWTPERGRGARSHVALPQPEKQDSSWPVSVDGAESPLREENRTGSAEKQDRIAPENRTAVGL